MAKQFLLCLLLISVSLGHGMTIDFKEEQELQRWQIINDTVMGGKSWSSVKTQDGRLAFEGYVSLENNGGFASTRRAVNSVNANQVSLRVQGDGRRVETW